MSAVSHAVPEAHVRPFIPTPLPAPVRSERALIGRLARAVSDWEDAQIVAASGECNDGECPCAEDQRGHDCTRCYVCEQAIGSRLDGARFDVVEAAVGAGLAADIAEAGGAA